MSINRATVHTTINTRPFGAKPKLVDITLHFEQKGNRYFVRCERPGVKEAQTTMMRIRATGRIVVLEDGTRLECDPYDDAWVAERLVRDPIRNRWINEGGIATGHTPRAAYSNAEDMVFDRVYYA